MQWRGSRATPETQNHACMYVRVSVCVCVCVCVYAYAENEEVGEKASGNFSV